MKSDSEGRIVRINRTELAMLGYTQEEYGRRVYLEIYK